MNENKSAINCWESIINQDLPPLPAPPKPKPEDTRVVICVLHNVLIGKSLICRDNAVKEFPGEPEAAQTGDKPSVT
jgi:hypothetical protein